MRLAFSAQFLKFLTNLFWLNTQLKYKIIKLIVLLITVHKQVQILQKLHLLINALDIFFFQNLEICEYEFLKFGNFHFTMKFVSVALSWQTR